MDDETKRNANHLIILYPLPYSLGHSAFSLIFCTNLVTARQQTTTTRRRRPLRIEFFNGNMFNSYADVCLFGSKMNGSTL